MSILRVLVVDDDPHMQLALKTSLSRAGHEVTVASDGAAGFALASEQSFDIIISDQRMPNMDGRELLAALQNEGNPSPFIMITAHGTIDQAVQAMQLGAADFISKPFSHEELLRVVERVVAPEMRECRARREKGAMGRPIITKDATMIRILEVCEAVARSDATVLVQGESGTGKELIARLLHDASPRVRQSFVAVNCAALPETLLESELFGHEKGAFTGAQSRKIGKFELAHGGTILLDEISEMDLGLQAKLLRVLQEREVDRVGGKGPIAVDVRVVATTNRNLERMIEEGKFRADLYYRLNVIPITLPALRDRIGDVQLLSQHFMRKFLGEKAPRLEERVLLKLNDYRWPGNVRELQNAIERAAILCQDGDPQESHFLPGGDIGRQILSYGVPPSTVSETSTLEEQGRESLRIRAGMTVSDMERALILETLRSTDDNRTQAAKLLGISIRTLRNKLNDYKAQGVFEGE